MLVPSVWSSATASYFQNRWNCSTPSPPESGCRCHCRKGRSAPRSIRTASSSAAKPSKSAGAGGSRFAGMFGIKEYPASTRPGLLNALLSAPFELILTQSFAFLSKADAKTVLTRKQNQLVSAQDPAASQIDELSDALDDLESNRFALGDHHLSLLDLRRDAFAAAGSHERGAARTGRCGCRGRARRSWT